MAANCETCNEPIVNSEFIKCDDSCNRYYHIKCVAVNKTTLNIVTSNPNVHWYCHQCNNDSRDVRSSIREIKSSISNISNAVSQDLVNVLSNGFKSVSDNLVGSIAKLQNSNVVKDANATFASVVVSGKKRQRETTDDDNTTRSKFLRGTSDNDPSMAALSNPSAINQDVIARDDHRKSIVVSNISTTITPDYLTSYVSKETQISADNIRVSLLKPAGISRESMSFLQYRVSVPASSYSALQNPNIWPRNVKIREYVWRPKNNTASLGDFLEKTTAPPATDQPIITPSSNTSPISVVVPIAQASENLVSLE